MFEVVEGNNATHGGLLPAGSFKLSNNALASLANRALDLCSGLICPILKLEVVRLIKEQGQSVQNVSDSINIGVTGIRRWLAQYSAELNGQPGIGQPLNAEKQRIRQLELENRQLRQDVDIKKTSALFAHELK